MLLYGLYAAVIDAILTLGLQILPIGSLIIAAIFIGWMPLMATLLIRGRKKGVIVSAPG
jgi:hypothetical protein